MFEKKLSMLESSYKELSKLDGTSRYVYGLGNVKPSTACKYMNVNNKIWKTILNFQTCCVSDIRFELLKTSQ